jgi:hypothetical protein
MGQLIAFPTSRRTESARPGVALERRTESARGDVALERRTESARRDVALTRRAMALELLYGLTYALGLFLAAPVLALVALAGLYDGEMLVSAGALVLLAAVLPLANAARRRV